MFPAYPVASKVRGLGKPSFPLSCGMTSNEAPAPAVLPRILAVNDATSNGNPSARLIVIVAETWAGNTPPGPAVRVCASTPLGQVMLTGRPVGVPGPIPIVGYHHLSSE